jgi:adhesin transport system membrane fusion protein
MAEQDLDLSEQATFDEQARFARWRMVALLVLLIALVVWAAVAEVDQVVRADGRIIPSARSQLIQHLEGGIVAELKVREGDVVQAGQLLVAIDPTRADATLAERKAKRQGLEARAARLLAEASGSAEMNVQAISGADAAVLQAESEAFMSRRDRLNQEVRVLREQQAQRRAELAEQETRQRSLDAEMELARRQLEVVQAMVARRAASQMEVLEAQVRVQRYATQIQDARSAMPKLRAAIAELEERIRDATMRFRAEARTELAQVRSDIERVEQEVRGESDRVARTDIRAPIAGVINRLYINTQGGVVRPGDPVAELTPNDEQVLIEAHVRPADRARLRHGIPAKVRMSAFQGARYGTLEGVVSEVSADTVPDEKGERYFRVRVTVKAGNGRIPFDQLSPGMTATADLVTGRRTVLDYLWSPVTRFRSGALTDAHD